MQGGGRRTVYILCHDACFASKCNLFLDKPQDDYDGADEYHIEDLDHEPAQSNLGSFAFPPFIVH